MSTQAQDLVVRKSVTVDCSQQHAFDTFTERIYSWWPFETHSPSDERPEAAVFEPRVGGRVYDRLANGEEHAWAVPSAAEAFCTPGPGTTSPTPGFPVTRA